MMKKSKVLIPSLVLGTVVLVGMGLVNNASANEETQYPPIVQKIAERFNLNQDEVKQFFDENREEQQEERQLERKTKAEERLVNLVEEGIITEEQKQLLIAKHEEMRLESESHREELENLSQEERREKIKEHSEANREEMKQWAEENGIDLKELFPRDGENRDVKRPFGPRK